jgi:hypothetical protein
VRRDGSVTRLIRLLRSYDSAARNLAVPLIWRWYFHDLLELARKNVDRRIRRREEQADVLQSRYRRFCLRQRRVEFDQAGHDALWSLLVSITLRKARDSAKRHGKDMRDVARNHTLPGVDGTGSARWVLEQTDVAGPSPTEADVLNEALELRLGRWPMRRCARLHRGVWRDTRTGRSPTGSIAPGTGSSGSSGGSGPRGRRAMMVPLEGIR